MIEKNIQVCLGKQLLTAYPDGSFTFLSAGTEWAFTGGNILTENQTISFAEMNDIRMQRIETGIGKGICIQYTGTGKIAFDMLLFFDIN